MIYIPFFCRALPYLPKRKKERALFISIFLKKTYPDAACALEFHSDPFRLLVMARLSAQCTDKRVNEVSRTLFQKYPDACAFAEAELGELEEAVRPCGLYRTKASQIREMSRILVRDYGGRVPNDRDVLLTLPGVGEKIANLMMGDVFSDPYIVADTHLIRLSGRFRLVNSQNPAVVTREMTRLIPKEERSDFCHRIILLGREVCRAQSPKCDLCPLYRSVQEISKQ